MARPRNDPNPSAGSTQVLMAFRHCLETHLPLALQHTRLTPSELWAVLGYASVHGSSIEAACTELAEAPSGNRVREVLQGALPEPAVLQRWLNSALRAQLPRVLLQGKRSYCLAIDCTLIPYHGQAARDDPAVLRAQAKAGTLHFHGYATVSIVHQRRRYVLALRLVRPGQSMVAIGRGLLNRVKRLGIGVRRVYLDKEFCSMDLFRTQDRRHLAYVVPLRLSPKLQRQCRGRRSRFTRYTLENTRQHRSYTVRLALVHRYRRSRGQRRVVRWFGFAVAGLPPGMDPQQVFQVYRQRFGIETSYRQMNQVRARTSSRSPRLRLQFVGLALMLVNLYVRWRGDWYTRTGRRPHSRLQPLTLTRLAHILARNLEMQLHVRPLEPIGRLSIS